MTSAPLRAPENSLHAPLSGEGETDRVGEPADNPSGQELSAPDAEQALDRPLSLVVAFFATISVL
jgi:hypothetical protein